MGVRLFMVVFVCAMVVAAPVVVESAITCAQVMTSLSPCIGYLRGTGGNVPLGCCNSLRNLNNQAVTNPDRQTACDCTKKYVGGIAGINYGLAAGLPAKCGVNLPYTISPSTDCTSVR